MAIIGAVVVAVALAGWGLWRVGVASAERRSQQAKIAAAQANAAKIAKATPSPKTKARKPSGSNSSAKASRPATITIAAVGDMVFDGKVRDLIEAEGGAAPLSAVADDLKGADVTIGNLESMLSTRGEPNPDRETLFRGDPRAVEGLSAAGFDFMSVANNHTMDYGPVGLQDSLTALEMGGIAHAGAGPQQKAAWKAASYERNGTNVGFLAYSHVVPDGYVAQADRPGLASGVSDPDRVKKAIKAAKKTHDYVVVSFHWGVENEDNANDEQRQWAHDAIDAGADMVIAHNPRVIQGVEFYKKGLIAYSLGDFVFDHEERKTGESFILHASIGPDGVADASAVPVYLNKQGKPEYVTGGDANTILKRLKKISEPYKTTVEIADDQARLLP